MTSLSLGLLHSASTGSRVNLGWFPNDKTVLDQLPYILACTQQQTYQNTSKLRTTDAAKKKKPLVIVLVVLIEPHLQESARDTVVPMCTESSYFSLPTTKSGVTSTCDL